MGEKKQVFIQTFRTHCESCGEEVITKAADMTGENEIIVDFLEGMEFKCNECDAITYLQVEKYT